MKVLVVKEANLESSELVLSVVDLPEGTPLSEWDYMQFVPKGVIMSFQKAFAIMNTKTQQKDSPK